jgi:hypothetical protein
MSRFSAMSEREYWDEVAERECHGVDPQLCEACVEGRSFCAFHCGLRSRGIQPQTRNLTPEQITALLKAWDRPGGPAERTERAYGKK